MARIPEKRQEQPRNVATYSPIYALNMRNEFLRCYSNDPQFVTAFQALETRHRDVWSVLEWDDRPGTPWFERFPCRWVEVLYLSSQRESNVVDRYVEDVGSFAKQWGLAGLSRGAGREVVHQALLWRHEFPELPVALQDHKPQVFKDHEPHEIPWVKGEAPGWPPKITFTITVEWPFLAEKQKDFLKRAENEARRALRDEVQSARDRIKDTGYVWPPEVSYRAMHLNWLYRRVAHRERVQDIAVSVSRLGDGREQTPDGNVRNTTDHLAKLIGLEIPRSPRSRRAR